MARRTGPRTIEEVVRTRLRDLRAARGLTQEELCEAAGVSVDAVNRIENGSRTPTLATLANLSRALSVEVSDLVTTEPLPPPKMAPSVQRMVTMLAGVSGEVQEAAEKVVRVLVSIARA